MVSLSGIHVGAAERKIILGHIQNIKEFTKIILNKLLSRGFELVITPIRDLSSDLGRAKRRHVDMRYQRTIDQYISPKLTDPIAFPPTLLDNCQSKKTQIKIDQFWK